MKTSRPQRISLYIGLALIVLVIFWSRFTEQHYLVKEISYSDFQQLAADRKVADLQIGEATITGKLLDAKPNEPKIFSTNRVDLDLADMLSKDNLAFSGEAPSGLLQSALGWLFSIIGFLAIWFLLMRPILGHGGYGGLPSFGKSKAKIFAEQDIKVRFADVAGVDEAKDELKEIVSFLQNPSRYGRLGAHIPKGILLVGPPGTGKTLLARAVAGEAGVPFFSMSGSEFVELFVGVGAARVRDLFEQARKQAPAIVFIDELDALGRARSDFASGGGHEEKEQTLHQLLTELDGFDPSVGVVFLAATNRPEILDPALLRAGRFDRQVLVDRPDKWGRTDILAVHLRKITLSPDVTPADVAALTPGFTGADLANLVNEAALVATRRGANSVGAEDFTRAIERIVAGLEKKNRLLNPRERKIVAYHEMGHAIVAMALPSVEAVQKVSIIPRGMAALGYTIQRPLEDRFLMGQSELMNRLTVLLGGRAAERLVFSEISTGAADDLVKATDIARNMVTRFGMDLRLGQVSYEVDPAPFLHGANDRAWRPHQYGQLAADAIDNAVRELIDTAFRRATDILQERLETLDKAASDLLSKETVSADELKSIIRSCPEPAAQVGKPTLALASGTSAN